MVKKIISAVLLSSFFSTFAVSASLEELDKKCDNGDGGACFELGKQYKDNFHGFNRSAKSVEYFKRACESGIDNGCAEYVYYGSSKNLDRLCDKGNELACAEMLSRVKDNNTSLWSYAKKACEIKKGKYSVSPYRTVGLSCNVLAEGFLYGKYGVKKNESEGIKILNTRCGIGDSEQCENLAELYTKKKEYKQAVDKLYQAVNAPSVLNTTYFILARMYFFGLGVEKDQTMVRKLVNYSLCKQEDTCFNGNIKWKIKADKLIGQLENSRNLTFREMGTLWTDVEFAD